MTDRRRALIALGLLVPVPSLGAATAMIWAPGPTGQALFMAAKVWLVAFPVLWYLAVERGRPSLSPATRGGLGLGLATGVAAGAAIWLAALLTGVLDMDVGELAGVVGEMGLASPRAYLLGALGWTFVNSLIEEFVYRWFVLSELERLVATPAAVLGSAAVFTAHHVVALSTYLPWGLTVLASTGVFLGGVLWAVLYARTRSIWPGWVSHVLADVAVFAVGWELLFG
ncbi:MAG: CPBP family intramembrane metalloprotease [Thermoanaerobaculales bacterium]|nr:CPBP family intramembrane metalloprotease [Thermoanaerobaculales bacterium]